ncbi:MAG TPA: hypothetical protein VHL98_11185 [Microvirga sp.]|jgi:hypothetical protein|nr:hypothetical protein [Microvirga sp.]
MANAVYPLYKVAAYGDAANASLVSGTVKALLVDLADYTYSAAHEFLSDVPAGARVATSPALTGKTFTNGLFDAADVTFTAVTGDQSEALILFIDTGSAATSRLVAFFDTGVTGLPVQPNGGDIVITWNAGGIVSL